MFTFGITINNAESVKSGTYYNFTKSHVFDPKKKITKIVTTVHKQEALIMQIKFFSGEELLCVMGGSDVNVRILGGRVVTFEIADDEQLIGAELYNGTIDGCGDKDYFVGVTWLKMKITN